MVLPGVNNVWALPGVERPRVGRQWNRRGLDWSLDRPTHSLPSPRDIFVCPKGTADEDSKGGRAWDTARFKDSPLLSLFHSMFQLP